MAVTAGGRLAWPRWRPAALAWGLWALVVQSRPAGPVAPRPARTRRCINRGWRTCVEQPTMDPEVVMAVRAIVFDIGGVLELPVDTHLESRWEPRLGLQPGEFFERLRRSGLGRAANLGQVSEAEFARGLAGLYGLDRRTADELLDDLWDWYVGELNIEMADYFQRLRPRYRTAILSNGAAGGRREEQARYGFAELADLLIYSYEVGMEKPDRRIYRITCERLGVRPGEAVFLDDLEANVAAAREVGMRAVRFQSTAQAIAEVEACLTP